MKTKYKILMVILICVVVFLAIFFAIKITNSYNKKLENEKLVQEYRTNKKNQYLEENNKYAKGEVEVVFLGDSLTDGCDISKYYSNFLALNRGIGGDRTYDVLGRLDYSVYALEPQVVVLLIGGNNLDSMFDDYEDILQGFKSNIPNTKVVLISLTPLGEKYQTKNNLVKENNKKIETYAIKFGYEYVNVFDDLYSEEIDAIYPEYTIDGAHLTDAGYQILTGKIKEKLNSILNK